MSWTKTVPFVYPGSLTPTVTRMNQGVTNTVSLTEGAKTIERLTLEMPAAITVTGTNNDYDLNALGVAPAVGVSVVLWNGASGVTFTGFASSTTASRNGEVKILKNITAAQDMTVSHESGSSTAANRVTCPAAANLVIKRGGSITMVYSTVTSRWLVVQWMLSDGAISTYTPAWSATGVAPAVGNGAISGSYAIVGAITYFQITLTTGGTTTFGTGYWQFTLPTSANVGAGSVFLADAYAFDAGGTGYAVAGGVIANFTSGGGAVFCYTLNNAAPFAWGVNGRLQISGWYFT